MCHPINIVYVHYTLFIVLCFKWDLLQKLNNVNLVDKIKNASETNQGIFVKKLDKMAKGRAI